MEEIKVIAELKMFSKWFLEYDKFKLYRRRIYGIWWKTFSDMLSGSKPVQIDQGWQPVDWYHCRLKWIEISQVFKFTRSER